MTGLTGQFQTGLPLYEAIVACAEAIDGLGWRIEDVEANRIVSRVDTESPHRPKIEVVLRESGQATNIQIIGTDTDAEPVSEDALIAELDRVRDAIKASLEGATEAPPQQGPLATSPPGPARGRPPGQSSNVGRRRMAIVGIIAGLLAIGIVGVAIVNDASEDPARDSRGTGRDLEGKKSTGTSQAKKTSQANQTSSQPDQSQEQQKQSQEPAAPGSLGLGDTAEIRDGDELLALTPTGVGREGSYVTLEIEVSGLGNNGYDTTGLEPRAILFGSNGRRYGVESSEGPGGCEPPQATLTNGRTLDGCLPFKVPQGVEADTFRYAPFFVGGESAEWDLE
jgi:hypothetical protein